eukprot:1663295-Prymnesium_polylepis.1
MAQQLFMSPDQNPLESAQGVLASTADGDPAVLDADEASDSVFVSMTSMVLEQADIAMSILSAPLSDEVMHWGLEEPLDWERLTDRLDSSESPVQLIPLPWLDQPVLAGVDAAATFLSSSMAAVSSLSFHIGVTDWDSRFEHALLPAYFTNQVNSFDSMAFVSLLSVQVDVLDWGDAHLEQARSDLPVLWRDNRLKATDFDDELRAEHRASLSSLSSFSSLEEVAYEDQQIWGHDSKMQETSFWSSLLSILSASPAGVPAAELDNIELLSAPVSFISSTFLSLGFPGMVLLPAWMHAYVGQVDDGQVNDGQLDDGQLDGGQLADWEVLETGSILTSLLS